MKGPKPIPVAEPFSEGCLMADVTLAILIYKDPKWLDFVLDSIKRAKTETPYEILIVANDPEPCIANDPRVNYIHRNADPSEFWVKRVYRAWNKTVDLCTTELIVPLNSDMYVSDYWLDELMAVYRRDRLVLPTSLLVESGANDSRFAEYARNFGQKPDTFRREEFEAYATQIRKCGQTSVGRLFMPVVFSCELFKALGGYPIGNPDTLVGGDQSVFQALLNSGMRHVTCHGSVVYHVQEGEARNGGPIPGRIIGHSLV